MTKLLRRVELITNLFVICAALVFVCSVGWLALRHWSSIPVRHSSIEKGTRLTIPGHDWTTGGQTLVLVLSTDCKYCTASASFYRRLIGEGLTHNTRFVAVLPQSPDESREYLAKLKIQFDDLEQAVPLSLGAKGTPTLILVNPSGVVIQSWEGQLPLNAENEVLAYVK